MFGIAAIVLECLAAIFYFTGHPPASPAGIACIGLACLAAHVTFGWPLAWRRSGAP